MKTIILPSNLSESQPSCRHCYSVTMTSGVFLSTWFLSTGPVQMQKHQFSLHPPLGFRCCLFDLVLRFSCTLDWIWTLDPLGHHLPNPTSFDLLLSLSYQRLLPIIICVPVDQFCTTKVFEVTWMSAFLALPQPLKEELSSHLQKYSKSLESL